MEKLKQQQLMIYLQMELFGKELKKRKYRILQLQLILLVMLLIYACGNRTKNKSLKPKEVRVEEYDKKHETCITIYCINDPKEYDSLNKIFQKKYLRGISGIDYLKILGSIKCSEITIEYECYQKEGWIQKEELTTLLKKVHSKEPCPKVITLSDQTRGDLLDSDSLHIPKSTVGKEALRLLNSYYLGFYPCEIQYSEAQIDSLMLKISK